MPALVRVALLALAPMLVAPSLATADRGARRASSPRAASAPVASAGRPSLIGTWRSLGPLRAGRILEVKTAREGGLAFEEIERGVVVSRETIADPRTPPVVKRFGRYEGQGDGVRTRSSRLRSTPRATALQSKTETYESWGLLGALVGSLPERSIERSSYATDGTTLRATRSRAYFRRQFGLFGDYVRRFTKPMGNTMPRATETYERID